MIFNKLHRTQTVRPLSNEVPLKLEGLLEIPKRFMGTEIDQSYAALYFFEHYIDFYKFEYVVEFGSRDGGLSIFLANMASITEQFIFHTFEYNKELDWYNRIKGGVGHWFDELEKVSPYIKSFEMDVFSYQTMDIVKSNIDKYKTLKNRMSFQKHMLHKILPNFDNNLSEWENMKQHGFDRIWDCGNGKYVFVNKL